jgi:hypothetical protein
MYCSICGAEATLDVNYCKRCGNILSQSPAVQAKPISLDGPSWAMAVTIICMVGIIFGGVIALSKQGVSSVALTWMVIVGLGTVVALVAMMFRQLSHLFIANQQRSLPAPSKPQVTSELYAGRHGALPEHLPSVTEHTTRTFEPAYREPLERSK